MRILYAIAGYGDEHIGGLIHREMALEIRRLGHSYEVVAPAIKQRPGRSLSEDGVPVHRLACAAGTPLGLVSTLARPFSRYPWFVTFAASLRRFLRVAPTPDVVIAEGAYPFGAMVWLASRQVSVPYIVTLAGGDFLANEGANYGYARYALPRFLLRATLRKAAVVRAISPYAGRRAVELGCPQEKLALVQRNIAGPMFLPDGVDRQTFRRAARLRIGARFELGESRLVVTVGRLLPIKGVDVLVRAIPLLAASIGDLHVIHVGANRVDARASAYRRHLDSLARSLGVEGRMTFVGAVPLEDVREFLAAADVAAVPSLEEGGNKTMVEAAAVGTPFVVTRTSGNADWARGWDCGVIVEPSSPDELAQGIARVLQDARNADAMGRNGIEFAREFRTAHVAARMLAICRVATAGEPVPAALREPRELLRPGRGDTVSAP